MKRSYKYRIYPTESQVEILNKNLKFCCFLYNCALEERKSYYKKYRKNLSYFKQTLDIKNIRKEFSEQTKTIYSKNLESVLKRVDNSFINFFKRVKNKSNKVGFPRFKSSKVYDSLLFSQCNFDTGGVKLLKNNKLRIFGIPGEVKIKYHRPFQGRCKQVAIVRQADKFFVVLFCDDVPTEHLAATNKTIAIDLGLTNFITTDDGTKFHHPKPYKTAKEKLAYLNQKLAAKQRGSNNRRKTLSALQKAHEKVKNIRLDFQHKLSKKFVQENDTIIVEKLNIQGMLEAKGFEVKKENIADASWGKLCCPT